MRGRRGAACPPAPRGSCSTQRDGWRGEGGAEAPGPCRPPPVPGPTWRELGRSKRRERSSARLVAVPRGAEGAPLALPLRPVPGATGAEAAMVPTTLAVQCLCWALLLPGHGPAQIFEWPGRQDSPLSSPTPTPAGGCQCLCEASTGHPQGTLCLGIAICLQLQPSAQCPAPAVLHSWVNSTPSAPVPCPAQTCSNTARACGTGHPLPAWCVQWTRHARWQCLLGMGSRRGSEW